MATAFDRLALQRNQRGDRRCLLPDMPGSSSWHGTGALPEVIGIALCERGDAAAVESRRQGIIKPLQKALSGGGLQTRMKAAFALAAVAHHAPHDSPLHAREAIGFDEFTASPRENIEMPWQPAPGRLLECSPHPARSVPCESSVSKPPATKPASPSMTPSAA
ncbi:hypothetical protein DSL92_06570 [Billgrantia gudaonensis]|uniref:Uncharacterized protein n=1 Tax=Billgrantia gudaonensis TaxID=376427 RepID=A0A432JIM6_9GAMM|nr:hypothetical protein DSL92_06570 [Halomonas gudaonensis]